MHTTPTGRRIPPKSAPGASDTPLGRDAVRRALVEAASRLFAERGVAAVSVRDIAHAAGVNHGLVHRHFGSKENLLRAVLDALSSRIAEHATGRSLDATRATGELAELFITAFTAVQRHPSYFRVLARALLDGKDVERLQSSFPMVEHLVQRVRSAQRRGELSDTLDPNMLVAVVVATGLGWLAFEPYLLASTGQKNSSPSAARRKFYETWLDMASSGVLGRGCAKPPKLRAARSK